MFEKAEETLVRALGQHHVEVGVQLRIHFAEVIVGGPR